MSRFFRANLPAPKRYLALARLVRAAHLFENHGFSIANVSNQTPLTMTWNYDYYADGRVNHAYDLKDNRFDRKLDYDDKGRLKEAYTGLEARGQAPTQPANSPFRQTFDYDEWSHMKERSGRLWKQALVGENSTYTNESPKKE